MAQHHRNVLWIPGCMGVGLLLLTPLLDAWLKELPIWVKYGSYGAGALLLCYAGWMTYKQPVNDQVGRGGRAGDADATKGGRALGGDGGDSTGGIAGAGGRAKASGRGSSATGGKGGAA